MVAAGQESLSLGCGVGAAGLEPLVASVFCEFGASGRGRYWSAACLCRAWRGHYAAWGRASIVNWLATGGGAVTGHYS